MSTARQPAEKMRQRGEWMAPADDKILELVRDHGNLTPKAISDFGSISRQYASARCSELVEYGLLKRVHHGLYGLTDDGRAFLDEELDASALDRSE